MTRTKRSSGEPFGCLNFDNHPLCLNQVIGKDHILYYSGESRLQSIAH